MSKPRYGWWSFARRMIELYPGRVQLLRDMQSAAVTVNYQKTPGHGEASRTTERLALVSLGEGPDREMRAVRAAIEETEARIDGKLRMELVRLYYWDGKRRLDAAARRCHISERTAQRWNGDFVRAVARYYGLSL